MGCSRMEDNEWKIMEVLLMPTRVISKHNNTYLRRSLNRHLLTFRPSEAEPKSWSVPATRRRARKQAERAGR